MSLRILLRHALVLSALVLMSAAGFASSNEKLAGLERIPTVEIVDEITDLEPHLFYLEDPDGALQIDEVLTKLDTFEPVPNGDANFGFTTSVYWLAVGVHNKTPQSQFVLEVDYPLLDFMDVYQVSAEGKLLGTVQETGDRLPFKSRYRPHRQGNSPCRRILDPLRQQRGCPGQQQPGTHRYPDFWSGDP